MNRKELIKWRSSNNYSQSQLARALGVDVMTVSRWERGLRKKIPSFLHLALECLEMKGGVKKVKGKKETRKKGEVKK
jgi:transcriptional regulator with XRE-family HTH domain